MILEKVYDELYGMIEDLKKKVGKGGSVVTITSTLQSGEKLADYSIDGTAGAIYAPPVEEIYSTLPRKVGKWIDNKDLYQQVITGTVTSSESFIDFPDAANRDLVKFECFLHVTGTNNYLLPIFSGSSTDRFLMIYYEDTGKFGSYASNNVGDVVIIAYYTEKTTQNTTKKKK